MKGKNDLLAKQNDYNYKRLLPIWINNAARNHPILMENNFDRFQDLARVPKYFQESAIIFGGGYSLKYVDKEIKKASKECITFCCSSNLQYLLDKGVKIDYCVIIDTHPDTANHLTFLYEKKYKNKLPKFVTTPLIDPEVIFTLSVLETTTYLFRPHYPNDYFLTVVLPLQYSVKRVTSNPYEPEFCPSIEYSITNAGSVANTILYITDLLNLKKKVYLLGVDYAYVNGHYSYREDPIQTLKPLLDYDGYTTNIEMLSYRNAFLSVWLQTSLPLYNLSPYSALIKEVPKLKIKDLKKDLKKEYYLKERVDREKYIWYSMKNAGFTFERRKDGKSYSVRWPDCVYDVDGEG